MTELQTWISRWRNALAEIAADVRSGRIDTGQALLALMALRSEIDELRLLANALRRDRG